MGFLHNGVLFFHAVPINNPFCTALALDFVPVLQQEPYKFFCICTDGNLWPYVNLLQFIPVNIHHNFHRFPCKAVKIIACLEQVHPRADGQEKIRILLHEIGIPLPHAAGPAEKQRMAIPYQVNPVPSRQDRNLQAAYQLLKGFCPARQADSIPCQKHWPFRSI